MTHRDGTREREDVCVDGGEGERTCVMDGAVSERRRERAHQCVFVVRGYVACRPAVVQSHVVCRHSDNTDLEAIDQGMREKPRTGECLFVTGR